MTASAITVVDFVASSNIVVAAGKKDHQLTISSVRTYIRVFRRLSNAVLDPQQPRYECSALYFF